MEQYMGKPLYHIHKPLVSRYRYYRLTGILTLPLTSNSEPINKLLNEIYKPHLDFAAWCLDIQNWYSRFLHPESPNGIFNPLEEYLPTPIPNSEWYKLVFAFPHPESPDRTFFIPYQPPSQIPGDSDNFGPGNKKPARMSEREKHNNMLTTTQYS